MLPLVLSLSALAHGDTLELPSGARIDVQVIDAVTLDSASPTQEDLLLKPAMSGNADYALPDHCLITADARLSGDRLRISTHHLTCIEAQGDHSEIYSGEISATAQESDGSVGVVACNNGVCERAELTPNHVFQLELASRLSLDPQENPSAEINERRRNANGTGTANPIPAERPDPDSN
ncbi:hypothetical protein HIO72_01410 [Halomonas sp. PA5]|uniref:hypothetical protein n=2 Tax=Halomonadaceae TaxID=28256 RepID=UPI0015972AC5|nr:hypothetical protein [Halomonas populi]QJQ96959.1 hypothetical protein HIO72_01410 [Halomonas sp. PA5]